MLVRFQDRIFLQEGRWYLWDSAIGLFRPIDGFAWNGNRWIIEDKLYTKDPLEKTYGFGSVEMLTKCIELSKKYESRIESVPTASYIAIGNPQWFRDRPVNFTHSASRDVSSWKRMVQGRSRTCKRRSTNKFTKRTL
jgi:hypothetical protein